MAVILDETGADLLDETGAQILDEVADTVDPLTQATSDDMNNLNENLGLINGYLINLIGNG